MNQTQRGQLARDDSNFPIGWNYVNITSQVTTVIKAGPGVLHSLVINTPVANSDILIYDSTDGSGKVIGDITIGSNFLPVTLNYDLVFGNGLTIVTTIGSTDITVTYI